MDHGPYCSIPVGAVAEVYEAAFLNNSGQILNDVGRVPFGIHDRREIQAIGLRIDDDEGKECAARVLEKVIVTAEERD